MKKRMLLITVFVMVLGSIHAQAQGDEKITRYEPIKGSFGVVTGNVGNGWSMSSETLKAMMAEGHRFQDHTYDYNAKKKDYFRMAGDVELTNNQFCNFHQDRLCGVSGFRTYSWGSNAAAVELEKLGIDPQSSYGQQLLAVITAIINGNDLQAVALSCWFSSQDDGVVTPIVGSWTESAELDAIMVQLIAISSRLQDTVPTR